MQLSRNMENMYSNVDEVREAIDLNVWLVHLCSKKASGATHTFDFAMESQEKSVIEDLHNEHLSPHIVCQLDEALVDAPVDTNDIFVAVLVKGLARGYLCSAASTCEAAIIRRLASFTATSSWTSYKPLLGYLSKISVNDRFLRSKTPLETENAIRIWGFSLCAQLTSTSTCDGDLCRELQAWIATLQQALLESLVS